MSHLQRESSGLTWNFEVNLFLLFRLSTDQLWPTHTGRAICFPQLLIQMLISSKNTLTDTPRIAFDYVFGHHVAHSSWHTELTITSTIPFLKREEEEKGKVEPRNTELKTREIQVSSYLASSRKRDEIARFYEFQETQRKMVPYHIMKKTHDFQGE